MLLNCVVYQKGVRVKDVPVAEIAEWRGRPDTFIWVALKDAGPDELATMQAHFGLHDLAVEDAHLANQRPKVEEYEELLFAVMHLVAIDKGEIRIGEVDVFVGKDFVLSVRTNSDQNFLGVRARAEREPKLLKHGPGYVLYALADAIVDRYFPVVDALECELEAIEASMFSNNQAKENIRKLYQLKQKVETLRHAVLPFSEAVGKLFGGRVPDVVKKVGDYFRDVHDHLLIVVGAIDTLRETIGTAIQANLAMVTIEQSEIAKKLAAWASIFAAMTALAGIWGMNFDLMPELKWRWGYPAALGAMVVVAGVLHYRFRRLGWL